MEATMERPIRSRLKLEGRTEVLIPRELKEAARAHTERTGAPLGAIVRIALKQYLEKQKVAVETE